MLSAFRRRQVNRSNVRRRTSVVLRIESLEDRSMLTAFTPLGDLAGGTFMSSARGVSADGSTVVGESQSSLGREAFRWTAGSGMVGLGDLSGSFIGSIAYDVSADGAVIVGEAKSPSGGGKTGSEAFRWTEADGMVGLGDLAGGAFRSDAWAVSDSGAVVAGRSHSSADFEPYVWSSPSGMVGLGDLPGGGTIGAGYDISADGLVIVGHSQSSSGFEAFRWTSSGGLAGLGDLPGGSFNSVAYGVSANGNTVVGGSSLAAGTGEAFRWTSETGMVGLGDLPGGASSSTAFDVSADGESIVGYGTDSSGQTAIIWDTAHGMRSLKTVLTEEFGVDLAGWRLTAAWAVSADGLVIVGEGINPSGKSEGWMANLAITDIEMQSATFSSPGQVTVNYSVNEAVAAPFQLAFYRSADVFFEGDDEWLDTILVENVADLAIGTHSITFSLGSGTGQVALPGFGVEESNQDYRLLAVANPLQLIQESDSTNNVTTITGTYHPAGGPVFLHSGEGADVAVVTTSGTTLTVTVNGTPHAYIDGAGAGVSEVRARLHSGADTFDALSVSKRAVVFGGEGSDDLRGSKGGDDLQGGDGADTIRVTAGADSLSGDADADLLIGANVTTTWNVTAANFGSISSGSSFSSSENLQGGNGADRFRIAADAGISGRIDGGAGANTLVGGTQANTWRITASNAGLLNDDPFANIGTILGGAQTDLFVVHSGGALTGSLNGSAGVDAIDFRKLNGDVTVNLATQTATSLGGLKNIESIIGGSGANTLIGPNMSSTWRITSADAGAVGKVTFRGFGNLTGGSADDTFVFSAGQSLSGLVQGGGGVNTVDYSTYVSAVSVNLASGAATGVASGVRSIQNAIGGAGSDVLTGNDQANVLLGNAGEDVLTSGGGNDILIGGAGNDTLSGGPHRSLLIGGRGADAITGGAADDLIIAGTTSHDANLIALTAILAEWKHGELPYGDRINHLRGAVAGGLNGSYLLTSSTVRDDGVSDDLAGAASVDWFWATLGEVDDLEAGEILG